MEQASSFGTLISTWLVLGNASGLVVAVGAAINGSSCNQALLQSVARFFVAGLILGFLGALTAYAITIVLMKNIIDTTNLISKADSNDFYSRELAALSIQVPESLELTADEERKLLDPPKLTKEMGASGLVIGLYLASAVCFGCALLAPITSTEAIFSSCRKATPTKSETDSATQRSRQNPELETIPTFPPPPSASPPARQSPSGPVRTAPQTRPD